jgi:hypothetical protein
MALAAIAIFVMSIAEMFDVAGPQHASLEQREGRQ